MVLELCWGSITVRCSDMPAPACLFGASSQMDFMSVISHNNNRPVLSHKHKAPLGLHPQAFFCCCFVSFLFGPIEETNPKRLVPVAFGQVSAVSRSAINAHRAANFQGLTGRQILAAGENRPLQ